MNVGDGDDEDDDDNRQLFHCRCWAIVKYNSVGSGGVYGSGGNGGGGESV